MLSNSFSRMACVAVKVAGFAAAAILAFLVVLLAPRVAHAAEFTVANTNNSGTGSLRTVISAANSNDNSPTMDTITFAIPDNPSIPGLEVKTISPTSALPPITEPVAIDGYTQPGASENTAITNANNAVLKIQLSGDSAPANAFGLAVGPDAAGTMIKGLVINRFGEEGVFIDADNTVIAGNFIGTNAAGTSDLGNGADGVSIRSSGNVVGGPANAAQNAISGNGENGVSVRLAGATNNTISNNHIGTDENAEEDLGNSISGVHIEGNVSQNEVAGNTLSGNGSGVEIFGPGATGNEVQGNFIGTNASIASGLGNSGFGVFINAPGNFVGGTASGDGNTIAFNGQDGVVIAGNASTGNRILRNAIFSNGGLGINLIGGTQNTAGATANDAKDPDTGPNTLQNKPVLTSLNGLTIGGELNSTPNRTFTIQFFANTSGNEGASFLGQRRVTTNSNGNVNFTFTATVGPIGTQNVTATATRAGNTSEFSAPRTATP